MRKDLQKIIERIAHDNNVSIEDVVKQMQIAMEIGQSNPNPMVQAKWASIPRKGNQLSLEEFLDYLTSHAAQLLS